MAFAACRKIIFPTNKCLQVNFQQIRATHVLKRRHEVGLVGVGKKPSLRQKNYIYDSIDDNTTRPAKMMNVLLIKYVEDLGKPGELVTTKEQTGRLLIMTQRAAYPSPENWAKYGLADKDQKTYSSKYVLSTMQKLSKFVLNVSMNKDNPWTLEPWHIRMSLRKARVHVPESAITMPKQTISGPDLNIQNKEFYITITINGQEKQIVRCRIHHWTANPESRLPPSRLHWKFPAAPMFEEDKEIAKQLPEIIPPVLDEDDNTYAQRRPAKK